MSIIENIKSVASTVQQIDNIELYRTILDVQKEAMDLLEDNRSLKEETQELRNQLKVKRQIYFDRESYWFKEENGKIEGPFCTRCWDVDKNLVRMLKSNNGYYDCPEKSCGSSPQVFPEQQQVHRQLPHDSNF